MLACGIATVGFVVLAMSLATPWAIAAGAAVLGVGAGFAFSSIINLVVDAVEPGDTGQATAVNTIVRTVGGAVGAQVATAILTSSVVSGAQLPAKSGYVSAFVVSAVALALAALVALGARSDSASRSHEPRR